MNFLWIAITRQKFWYWLKSQVVGPTYYKNYYLQIFPSKKVNRPKNGYKTVPTDSLKQLKVANKVDNFTN